MLAHYDRESGREQTLEAHVRGVGRLGEDIGQAAGLPNLLLLIGLLHDSGKATKIFNDYLRSGDPSLRGKINHSACGARWIVENLLGDKKEQPAWLAANMAVIAIISHHSGLPDLTSLNEEEVLQSRYYPKKETYYEEAADSFLRECASRKELADLFKKAQGEVEDYINRLMRLFRELPEKSRSLQLNFFLGLTIRFLYSGLIDSDRYDTYLFYAEEEPEKVLDRDLLWRELAGRLEAYIKGFSTETPIDRTRGEISRACLLFADKGPGVYQLYVPTGGGKTLSSLRFALNTARKNGQRRIFYIAPFKTILEQNASEIRRILNMDEAVLEHHSDVIPEDSETRGREEEISRYSLLTQRWTSPIILTTMVQFLNTLFSGRSQCARRFHALAGSVILLDEVQAMPVKCISMVNTALNFLAYQLGCSIVLCTATQPNLDGVPVPVKLARPSQMVSNQEEVFADFKRVEIVDQTHLGLLSSDGLGDFVEECLAESDSALVVMNTKSAARRLFECLKGRERKDSFGRPVTLYYLSTSLCPAHRLEILRRLREDLEAINGEAGRPWGKLVCISTQLIEAGVNLSFQCTVRSLAGLDSIAQAAGRCNRHGEAVCRKAYIIRSAEENLSRLPDIQMGQNAAQKVLEDFSRNREQFDGELLSPKAIDRYYRYYLGDRESDLDYPVKKGAREAIFCDTSLFRLLSDNEPYRKLCQERGVPLKRNLLNQAFDTAGSLFQVIEDQGTDVIVPYGKGKELIADLNAQSEQKRIPRLLRLAQRYTVHLFDHEIQALSRERALYPAGESGAMVLQEGYYHPELGVQKERGDVKLEILEF